MGTQFGQGTLFRAPFLLEGSVPEPGLSIVA